MVSAQPQTVSAPFSIRAILAPLAAIVLGTFMAILDNTVVNVALPTLERIFNSDLHVMQWVITAYMLAQAAVIPLAGWLSDRYGARRIYLVSLVLFTIGSVLCALAPGGEFLVLFRVLQGLGGGMLMPVGMSFLYRLAPPEKRGTVMGMFGIPILLAPALGPVLSGWLIDRADWRLIFLINVPIGIAALLLGLRALPHMAAQQKASTLDVPGAILGPVAFAALTYGISESINAGWTGSSTLLGIGAGTVALLAFIAVELRTDNPLLDLRVFRSVDFTLTIVTQWAGQIGLFGALFLIPLFLQQVHGYGAFDTGLYLLPQAFAAAVAMPVGGRLFDRFGVRVPVITGLFLVVVSAWLLTGVTSATTGADLRWLLVFRGLGMGLMMMPLNTHLLNAAPKDLVSRVTALTGALQNVVGSLGIAGLATVLQSRMATHLAAAQQAGGANVREAAHQAMGIAYADTFAASMVPAIIGLILALTLRSRRIKAEAATTMEGNEAAHAAVSAFAG